MVGPEAEGLWWALVLTGAGGMVEGGQKQGSPKRKACRTKRQQIGRWQEVSEAHRDRQGCWKEPVITWQLASSLWTRQNHWELRGTTEAIDLRKINPLAGTDSQRMVKGWGKELRFV